MSAEYVFKKKEESDVPGRILTYNSEAGGMNLKTLTTSASDIRQRDNEFCF
jgi:hypothetical protein